MDLSGTQTKPTIGITGHETTIIEGVTITEAGTIAGIEITIVGIIIGIIIVIGISKCGTTPTIDTVIETITEAGVNNRGSEPKMVKW